MKKFLLASLLAVALCGTANAEGLKVGVSFQEMNNEYFVVMKEALQDVV